ncbi:hypothetical protein ACFP3U_16395 [Kitasatospora misakiensis]|uniref:Uncharacterized protein n=1 Tax=Kitasatospora misakiensis TaxID=67330 RepID=A0ABW0X200_9ACTN
MTVRHAINAYRADALARPAPLAEVEAALAYDAVLPPSIRCSVVFR